MKLDKVSYTAILILGLLCVLRGATLYFWWNMPNIEMASSPAIYKGVQYPVISFTTLLIGLPGIAVLMLPKLRTLPRAFFISGIFVSYGIASIAAAFYLSTNVAGGGGIFILSGMYIYRVANKQFAKCENA